MIYMIDDNYDGCPFPIARITITSILPHNEPVGYHFVTKQQTHRSVLSDSQYQSYRKDSDPIPDSKVHGANMGPIWGRHDPGGPHVGSMNFAIWNVAWYTCDMYHSKNVLIWISLYCLHPPT